MSFFSLTSTLFKGSDFFLRISSGTVISSFTDIVYLLFRLLKARLLLEFRSLNLHFLAHS